MMVWVTTSSGEGMKITEVETPRSLIEHISLIPDPRVEKKCRHKLVDIVALSICATLCGADDWNTIEEFGEAKEDWFKRFLELPNGIPSHDTYRRVFSILSADDFEQFFSDWVREAAGLVKGVVAIDEKSAETLP
jgi:hypothetical protein